MEAKNATPFPNKLNGNVGVKILCSDPAIIFFQSKMDDLFKWSLSENNAPLADAMISDTLLTFSLSHLPAYACLVIV